MIISIDFKKLTCVTGLIFIVTHQILFVKLELQVEKWINANKDTYAAGAELWGGIPLPIPPANIISTHDYKTKGSLKEKKNVQKKLKLWFKFHSWTIWIFYHNFVYFKKKNI